MAKQKSIGKYTADIPKRNGEQEREARVSVPIAEVRLQGTGESKQSLPLCADFAKELSPPEGERDIELMLLMDLPVEDLKQPIQNREY